jgi:uncharacterized cupredoxin-like copper-binding protein
VTTPRRRLALAAAAVALAGSAGVAAAASGGGPGEGGHDDPATGPATVTVTLTARHSRFTPPAVTVPAGTTVRFVVRNLDPIDHELIVGGPEVHRHHATGRDTHHHGDVPGEISVPAGETASTTWTAPASGDTAFACHLPGHLAHGMAGVVRVSPRT